MPAMTEESLEQELALLAGGGSLAGNASVRAALGNATGNATKLPLDMTFNSGHVVAIIFYPILMVISAVGNITVFVILLRRRKKGRSRINSMLMHLSIADLLVTFLMMPLETAWNYTVVWHGGDVLCRIMSFNRIFGLYLSSFVLVCISVDRYFAVLRPMQINDRRGRWMLVGAWIAAFVCSLPQMVVFQALTHPEYTWYVQCITTGMLTTRTAAVAYAVFGMVAIYCVPLSVIIFSYASIIVEIYRRSREPVDDKLRRSSLGFLGRAKARTLKMTIIIVLVFFVCSTPYYIMMVWYWVDEKAVQHVDPRVQKGLLLFCSANSCMNPIVYGAFNIRTRRGTSQRPRPENSRLRALGLLRLVSWRRDREDDCAAARDTAALPDNASSSEHAAHALGHRGSRGSQGSEVSCVTEWSVVQSTSCLEQGLDSAVGPIGGGLHGGPQQADAEKRPQRQHSGLQWSRGSLASVQGLEKPPAGRQPENHRFRLAERSSSAPGLPLGGPGHRPGPGPGCHPGGRLFELRREPAGGAASESVGLCARRYSGGRGARAGGRAGGAAAAEQVTSSM